MQISLSFKNLLVKSFLLVWSISCVFLFMVYAGNVSFIHQFSNLMNWQGLALKIVRVEPVYYLGNLIGSLLGILLFFLAYVSFGIFCLKSVKIIASDKMFGFFEQLALIATAFLIGREISSVIFFLLAGFYKLTPEFVIFIVLVSLLVGIRPLINFFADIYRQGKDNQSFFQTANKFDKLLLLLAVAIIFLSLMYSSSRLSYDAVGIYFSNAKITAMTNQIQFFSDALLNASSFQDGIQYAAIIQVFGDQTARMYSWMNGIAIIFLSLALAEKLGLSKRAKLILLVLLLTSTAFLDLMGDGKIDLASSTPIIAAVYWMVADYKDKTKKILLLIGFLAGIGMIARPYNIFLEGVFLGLFYFVDVFAQKGDWRFNLRLLLKYAFWIAPGVLLLFGYLLFTNWVIAGNPLTPLLGVLNYKLSDWDWPFDPKDIWKIRLMYLFVVTFLNSSHGLGTISPFFLAFLPSLLLADVRKRLQSTTILKEIIIVTVITLILWIVLFFTVLEIRYVLFLWIILFIAGAQIIESALASKGPLFRGFLGLMVVVVLSYVAFRTIYISLDTYSPLDKDGVAHCYDSSLCVFFEPVNKIALPGDRVLVLNAYRYYLRPDLFACSSKREEYVILKKLSEQKSNDFWVEVYRQGYKFVTYEQNFSEIFLHFDLTSNLKNTPAWLKLKPVHSPTYQANGEFEVSYQIIVNTPPIGVDKICKQPIGTKRWEILSASASAK